MHIVYVDATRDQGPLLGRVSIAMYTVAVAFVALRCFTRGYIVKKFGLDDLFIAIAVTLGGAQTVTILLEIEHGEGRHSSELLTEEFNDMLLYNLINMLIYFVANWAVKMSILALYYRIGYGKQGLPWIVQSRVICITAGFITAFSLAVFLAQLLFCHPISRAWDVEGTYGSCFNGALFMVISGAMDVATDVILLLFPLPLLRLLKFNRRQRTALAIILSIGLIPVVASTMRLCEIVMSEAPSSSSSAHSWQASDFSWTWAWVPVWSQIEIDIAIVAASLPSLSPLLQKVWTGFHRTHTRASTPSQIPTLPGYRESWRSPAINRLAFEDEKAVWDCDVEKMEGYGVDVEKRLTVREKEMGISMHIGILETSYYDDSLLDIDKEEAKGRRSIRVARLADVQIVTRTRMPRVVEYVKL